MILKGDCIEVMKAMKPNSVDAVVCDPPYGLEFMGKEWDKLIDKRPAYNERIANHTEDGRHGGGNNPYVQSRVTYQAGLDMQLWHTQWLTEAYRVLKPGGSMLVMGGTRTFHRLACAIEDTGFIIKDTLMWLYGSGFPKAQDLGKMIDKRMGKEREVIGKRITGRAGTRADKRNANLGFESGQMMINETTPSTDLAKHWDGFKVGGIKPAYEPIIWAVKPPEGSYMDNVLKWGVGAVNVDECRVGTDEYLGRPKGQEINSYNRSNYKEKKLGQITSEPKGRFPANVILDEEAGRMLDEQSGNIKTGGAGRCVNHKASFYGGGRHVSTDNGGDSGGASRFFYCAKASRGERNAGLDDLMINGQRQKGEKEKLHGQSGGAQQALREGKSEYMQEGHIGLNKIKTVKNNPPTVKPIKLFEYLIKLITREGQIVLDPFMGSGTTSIAAHNTGRKCIGIEKENEYLVIAKKRIHHWKNKPRQLEIII